MKKLYGYLIAGLGLIGMFLSSSAGQQIVPFFSGINKNFILYPSLVLVGLGIVILIVTGQSSGGKIKQVEKEVPIYQGTGKKRKIIGYRIED